MKRIDKYYKKDIPSLLNDNNIWHHHFLASSKNRLYSLFKNPDASSDDLVLLLAYLNDELVGYMGIYINNIKIDQDIEKIGWLSTWWVHPKTKGTGIGLDIFNTMYESNHGNIGISQFTDSAKRVYDKSGHFNDLINDVGYKSVLRSHLISFVPGRFPKAKMLSPLLSVLDHFLNFFINIKLNFIKKRLLKKLSGYSIEYLITPDDETMEVIKKNSQSDISIYSKDYFDWLKAYNWIEKAPVAELTDKEKYLFSNYDDEFEISYLKINQKNKCIGFVVLQKRNYLSKVLFSYYDKDTHSEAISDIVKLQAVKQNTREIICFDTSICQNFKTSNVFLFHSLKKKKSIISKKYIKADFSNNRMHYGDGDCAFA
jgi:hypothetical protein